MAPTCASNNSRSEEETSPTCSSSNATAACSSGTATVPTPLTEEELLDSGPFYGMFDRDSDEDEAVAESSWAQLHPSALSPRAASIPGASETFQKVMRQLDGIGEDCAPAADGVRKTTAAGGTDTREHRSCPVVKKAASFSASDCASASSSSSSSSSSKDSAALAAEAKRRRSVPCMGGGKHVQWADEAGVAELVSVRLIRPRLQAKGEKEEAQVTAPRSILKRLMGVH